MSSSGPARLSQRVLAILVGAMLGLFVTVVVLWFFLHDSTPTLTREELDDAARRWQRAAIDNYDLDLEIFGRQPGVVHLEVRSGVVAAMTRDGRTPSQRRTWEAWTIDNQLATIRDELDHARDPVRGFGAPAGSQVVQRAKFDATLGYPLDYQRSVLGTPLEVEWRVTRFVRIEQP